jgi:6-phosphogluconolactonase
MNLPEIMILPDAERLAQATAERFAVALERATRERGLFTVALSGGSTPKALYELLARDYRDALDWSKTHFFWGDERNVSADDVQSNFRMAYETLLSHLPIIPEQVHRIPTRTAPNAPAAQRAATEYDRMLREFFHAHPESKNALDLVLLGLGEDGHTASLMPDAQPDPFRHNPNVRVLALFIPHLRAMRITLTADFINQAREVIFEVSGEKKATVVRDVLAAGTGSVTYPAARIAPESGTLAWFIDQDAAQRLDHSQAA